MKKVAVVSLVLCLAVLLSACAGAPAIVSPAVSTPSIAATSEPPSPSPAEMPAPSPSPVATPAVVLPSPVVHDGSTYKPASGRFSVAIPQGWLRSDENNADGERVIFGIPAGADGRTPGAAMFTYMNIGSTPASALDMMYEIIIKQSARDAKTIAQGKKKDKGASMAYYEFTGYDIAGAGQDLIRYKFYFLVKGPSLYVIAFSSFDTVYDEYKGAFDKIYKSFKIL